MKQSLCADSPNLRQYLGSTNTTKADLAQKVQQITKHIEANPGLYDTVIAQITPLPRARRSIHRRSINGSPTRGCTFPQVYIGIACMAVIRSPFFRPAFALPKPVPSPLR